MATLDESLSQGGGVIEGDGMLVAVSICPAGTDMIPCRRVSGVVVVLLFLPR